MTVVLMLDESSAMAFHGQRQSSDRSITDYVVKNTSQRIVVSPYTANLIRRQCPALIASNRLLVDVNPFEKASGNDIVINEEFSMRLYAYKIDRLLIARWHETYPGDLHSDLDLSRFALTEKKEIKGESHERITLEFYIRK